MMPPNPDPARPLPSRTRAKSSSRPRRSRARHQASDEISDSIPGRVRVLIESVKPEIDSGLYPVRRALGEKVKIDAILISDGHDALSTRLLSRHERDSGWTETHLMPTHNDHWLGEFTCEKIGNYFYTVEGWVDRFKTWRRDLRTKFEAGQDIGIDLLAGVPLLREAAHRASESSAPDSSADAEALLLCAQKIEDPARETELRAQAALDESLGKKMDRYPDRTLAERYRDELRVVVERKKSRFSAWYEMFPRSASPEPGRHGTFKDCQALLPYVAGLGFDVLYFPPIHPIGRINRKGPNNRLAAGENDPGSPWAIGASEGGHKSVHPELGTLDDFRALVREAEARGLEIALDIAFQCAPDHPYVQEHPEWFRRRPDGSIQYAENPPKKYQDIYPFDFESPDWKSLWIELRDVFLFWIGHGVKVFRVDNPHTKSFRFWRWCISSIKERHPEVIFLSEAFTRPNIKYHLAKIGFTQSYTYFAWRNRKEELIDYLTELTRSEVAEYCVPNLWPNTPDILTDPLQQGGRPLFIARAVLAATLSSSYGIYGPAYELIERVPRDPGSEEYLDSEKYQIRHWNRNDRGSIAPLLKRLNLARRDNPALQSNGNLHFHEIDHPELICYSKSDEGTGNLILVIVNLDPKWKQSGWTRLRLDRLGIASNETFLVQDLLTEQTYEWRGDRNYVELDPSRLPAHLFRVIRTERKVT